MNFPKKFYQGLILLLLAILSAYFLSPFVFSSKVKVNSNLSEILEKGPAINKVTSYNLLVLKLFFASLAVFATVKGYEYFCNHRGKKNQEVKKYKDILSTISFLEEKSDPPKFINRRKKKKNVRKKSTRFSEKQTKKIINSSQFLSKFEGN